MTPRPLAWIALSFTLLAGTAARAQHIEVVTEASSYSFLENGKPGGPAGQVVEATLQRAGLTDHRITLYPWARAYDLAQRDPNVLIYLLARTPAREAQFKWVGELLRTDYHFYKLRERKDVVVRDLQEAKNYSIGVIRDDFRQQYLQGQGFAKVVISANNTDNFRKLLNQQIQLAPLSERDVVLRCEEAKVDINLLEKVYTIDGMSTGLYMAYSQATPEEIVARTRDAFDKLKAEGTVASVMKVKR